VAAMKATHSPTIAPVSDPMRPSALLRGAALYLGTHGWTQHQFYDLVADTNGPFPPACASGAIMTAATGKCLATGMCGCYDDNDNAETVAIVRALRVFAAFLDPDYSTADASAIDVIGDWNDHDGRNRGEVIETLMDAANDWENTHHTGGAR
jgi:hypothetical protein